MRTGDTWTEADFETLSWHDCNIWGMEFQTGDADEGEWTSDVIFNIDYIAEWICGVDRSMHFRVAPARLTFHGVTDPRVAIDWGRSGFQVSPIEVSINRI